jgi:hypothetical protein
MSKQQKNKILAPIRAQRQRAERYAALILLTKFAY